MAKFRWISKDYPTLFPEVSQAMAQIYIGPPQTEDQYNEQVQKDIGRMPYVNFYLDRAEMQKYLSNLEDLDKNNLSYAQGDFYAAFSELIISVQNKQEQESPNADTTALAKALSFCYVNDDNKYCGFSIQPYVKIDKLKSPPQKTFKYVLSHIKNVKRPLHERQATLLMSDDLIPNTEDFLFNKEFGSEIDAKDISQELILMLESSSIAQLLSGLIDKQGALNLAKYEEIYNRTKPDDAHGKNIDDRDAKMQIWGQIILWAKLTEKSLTSKDKQDLKESLTKMLTQQDYFLNHKKEDLEAYLKLFKEQRMVSDSLPSRSQQEEFVNSVLGKMDEFLQHKKTDDAGKFNVVKLYGYTSYQEWLDAKNLPLYSRIPHFTKVLSLTVAVGLTLAGLAASGVLIVPVAIALAVAFVGLCSWLAKKVYSLRIDDKKIEEKITTITETNQIEEKTKTAVTEILGDDFARVLEPKPRVQPSSFFQPDKPVPNDGQQSKLDHQSS